MLSLRAAMANNPQFTQILETLTQQLAQFTETFTNQLQLVQNQVNGLQVRDEPNHRYNDFVQKPKLTCPRFESGDPTEWLYKINKFFEYHRTPETHKLSLATLHLDGAASTWYQWMETNHLVRTWPEFEMQIRIRFGPSPYEDPNTQLAKLKQTGTFTDYEVQFQSLTNGLPESFLKGRYIGGLRHDIQCEVIASQPYNLQQAIGLSRLYEGKFSYNKLSNSQTKFVQPPHVLNPKPISMFHQSHTHTTPLVTEKAQSTSTINPSYHNLPIKRLTYAERQAKNEKGQCYNCEEKWHKGHKCKGQMSLLLLDGVVPEGCEDILMLKDTNNDVEGVEEVSTKTEHGNLYALIGNPDSKCLRLQGEINNKFLQILVDRGSSHNFIQTRVAKFLGLTITPSTQFSVIVGNGQNLKCVG